MDKSTIKKHLIENHDSFIDFVYGLNNDDFLRQRNDKWSAGQQIEHIYLSIKPLRQVLSLPKTMLKLTWGLTNRESYDYDALVKKYLLKLENGGVATGRFVPEAVSVEKGQKLRLALKKEVESLCSKVDKFTEDQLDTYVIPHPLLGKLTIREMLYFTIYHVNHHHNLTMKNLSN